MQRWWASGGLPRLASSRHLLQGICLSVDLFLLPNLFLLLWLNSCLSFSLFLPFSTSFPLGCLAPSLFCLQLGGSADRERGCVSTRWDTEASAWDFLLWMLIWHYQWQPEALGTQTWTYHIYYDVGYLAGWKRLLGRSPWKLLVHLQKAEWDAFTSTGPWPTPVYPDHRIGPSERL